MATATADITTLDDATDDEMLAYTTAYIVSSNALGDAIIVLKRLESITFDPNEQTMIVLERRRLEDQYAKNERSFHAVMSGDMAMNPPSQDEVDAIVQLAAEVARLTQQVTTVGAVLRLANDVASRFAEIRGPEPV
jgi:hypothetical protein